MSKDGKSDPERHEGWEGLAEETSEGNLRPNEELEAALREAEAAVEERRTGGRGGAPGGASAEVEALRAELEETRQRMMRVAADFENFRKRTLKERQEALQYGHQNLVKDLLPTVDNLERAIEAARKGEEEEARQALLEGVELVLRELRSVLERHGVVEIEAEGRPFDPAVHEAMAQRVDESVPPNTVVDVFQRGYSLRDRLLRPARVVVSTSEQEGGKGGAEGSEG